MTRRKTRSSQLYEIVSGLDSSQESIDNTASSSFSFGESNQQEIFPSQNSIDKTQAVLDHIHENRASEGLRRMLEPTSLVKSSRPETNFPESKTTVQPGGSPSAIMINKDLGRSSEGSDYSQAYRVATLEEASSQTPCTVQEQTYLQNRPNTSIAKHQEPSRESSLLGKSSDLHSTPSNHIPPLPLKHTSSLIRLSMSLDGKARVTTDTGSSPSPPRLRPASSLKPRNRSNVGLQRSQSAIEQNGSLPVFPQRCMTGRSRDARSWEFYCDSDASSILTEQAEREQSGSAIGPISLIRSQSNKSMMASFNQFNVNTAKPESTKRQRSDSKITNKPKLARAASSVARLQTVDGNVQKQENTIKDGKPKFKPRPAMYEIADGDSDKENWEPGTQSRRVRRRHVTNSQASSPAQRAILEESSQIPSQSSSLDTLMNRESVTPRASHLENKVGFIQENTTSEFDHEVFINGSSISRGVEDLEGVQNLLALSKAAW